MDSKKREKAISNPVYVGSCCPTAGPMPDPEKDAGYTVRTDHGLASDRSKTKVRTHAELAAAKMGEPSLGEGISSRQALAGQGVNDQFPYTTDNYGKQIA